MQVEAERKKRAVILDSEGKKTAAILESEGNREAQINIAEGQKRSRVLASGNSLLFISFNIDGYYKTVSTEAEKQEIINNALGEAQGLIARAEARANSLRVLSSALETKVYLCSFSV